MSNTKHTPKPILLMYYLPAGFLGKGGREISATEMNDMLHERFQDYYTLAVPSNQSADGSCEDIRLQVFYEKDFTPIQYEELKKMIMDSLPEKIKP